MRIALRRTAMWILLLGLCPGFTWAQQASTKRTVVLRRDPSKSAPIVAHLAKGDRLMLVQMTADGGFYHVKTEHDQIGWVLSIYVVLSPAPPQPPTPPPNPTPIPPDTGCDTSLWNHVYHSYRLIVHQQCLAVTGRRGRQSSIRNYMQVSGDSGRRQDRMRKLHGRRKASTRGFARSHCGSVRARHLPRPVDGDPPRYKHCRSIKPAGLSAKPVLILRESSASTLRGRPWRSPCLDSGKPRLLP